MTDTTQHMIEVQPINSLADIPTEIWFMMSIQLVLMALIFWLIGKGLSKFSAYVLKLIHGPKTNPVKSSDTASLDDDWSDIEAAIKKEDGNV